MTDTVPVDDSTGKRIAKGCLLALLFITVLFAGSCWLLIKNKDKVVEGISSGMDDFFTVPYYGEEEYIQSRYGELLNTMDLAAQNSNSYFMFASVLENLPLPEEIIFIAIDREGEEISIIKKMDWKGKNSMLMGKFGAGNLKSGNDITEIMIYQNPGPWTYMDRFVVYIKHASGLAVPDN